MATFAYENQGDMYGHARAIQNLAAWAHIKPEDVRLLYEQVLAELQEHARITSYLSIFVTRRVERILRTRMGASDLGNDQGPG